MSKFEKGQPVICIDATRKDFEQFRPYQYWIQKEVVYHIRHNYNNDGIVTGVLLEEIKNNPIPIKPLGGKMQEPAFAEWRFRNLTQDERDVL